jgi:hypothetical protein
MVPWRNRGPPMNVHTRLHYLARAGIIVSSHNPLWDYINVLSWHNLFLLREILYWCQFGNGVMGNDLWCRSETESPLWMYTQGYAAWRMLVSRSLAMIHYGTTLMCYLLSTFHETISMLFIEWSSNIYHLCWIKRAIPLSCVVLFLLILVVITHRSSLCILVVKVKPWSFLVLENSWLALKMEIDFPGCWDAGVCSFVLLFNPCISYPSGWFISHEETDKQPDQMDFYPNAWPFACKCELWTLGLPMVLEDLLNFNGSSTSWFLLTCNCFVNKGWV